MSKLIIHGGHPLSGNVRVSGAKNAILPILAATLLAEDGHCTIHEVPYLDDVKTMQQVLESLGAHTQIEPKDKLQGIIHIHAKQLTTYEAPYELVTKMRASFLVAGPLLSRLGKARVPLPGGCAIGTRAIDQHLKGFEALGATITIGQGFIQAQADGTLKGAKIYLDIASVGATENIMMAAALAEGTTTIENAAKEPEITDLANIMNLMGANVRGAGTDTIRIEGVERLHGVEYTVIPDRIEAGTYMIAAAITGSDIHVEGAIIEHLVSLVAKLTEMGVEVEPTDDGVYVRASGRSLKSVDIKTLPYPGFPTDLQAQMMALLLKASGASVVTEMLFENRYMHVQEFRKMNAQIKVDGRSAFIVGGSELSPAKLIASDLRAAAALILIALATEGETEITGLQHLDRGYVDIVGKLSALGADIVRLTPAEVEMQELRGQALHGQSPHLRIVN